jgi:hypothetical protein
MSISNYLEAKILDHVLRNTSYTPASTVYLALHTTDPGETGTGAEVTGGSGPYARKSITFAAASGGSIAMDTVSAHPSGIDFSGMPGCTVTHVALWDALSSGNCLWSGALTSSRTVTAGDTLRITSLTVTLD